MAVADVNSIILSYLTTASTLVDPLIALVGAQIYCPRLPENVKLLDVAGVSTPAISFFSRGGISTPYIPGIVTPSVQFDCWAMDAPVDPVPTSGPIKARQVYCVLYSALQGIQNVAVGSYQIMSAIEEVQGMDLVDETIPEYYRVLTFFSIMIRAE